jgi:hypothetical protein
MVINKDKRSSELIIAITGIIALIVGSTLSGIALWQVAQNESEGARLLEQANNLTQTSILIQNITSNFEPYLIPYSVVASVADVYSNSTLDPFGQFDDHGSLNVSLVVITPHASIINFTDKAFAVTVRKPTRSDDFLDPTSFFGSNIYLEPSLPYGFSGNRFFYYWPETFVQPGVTQVNFAIPILAELALNSNFTAQVFGGNLGTLTAQVTMFDVQTQKYVASYNFSTTIFVNVNWHYG